MHLIFPFIFIFSVREYSSLMRWEYPMTKDKYKRWTNVSTTLRLRNVTTKSFSIYHTIAPPAIAFHATDHTTTHQRAPLSHFHGGFHLHLSSQTPYMCVRRRIPGTVRRWRCSRTSPANSSPVGPAVEAGRWAPPVAENVAAATAAQVIVSTFPAVSRLHHSSWYAKLEETSPGSRLRWNLVTVT